jgi:NADH-quinone oxidoreductase subunit L
MATETTQDILTSLPRWIILAPVIGAAVNGLLNRSKNALISGTIGTLAALTSFVIVCTLIAQHGMGSVVVDNWFTWFDVGHIKVPFTLELVPFTKLMLLVVTGVGSLIHLYSVGYMSHDKSPWRFFSYLNLFLAAMLVLVLSGNLVGTFLGWEGVGLCSYLLVGFWYEKDENAAAGMKAFITNRVGDLGFLVALFAAFTFAGTGSIRELIHLASVENPAVPAITWLLIAGGLFWASTGKSAQIPLYIWLPDAMAGPTPVSALIHAATMVTSGIVVTVRLWPIFAGQPGVLDVMLVIGTATALLAAFIALTQRDIKKVLAYSTISQLGFMFAALGAGAPTAAFFHVVTHACFKALLFLGAGSVIHGMHEKQDLFEMGNLRHHMKVTHWTFLAGTLAIIGFPLTAGFFSKDTILAKGFEASPFAYIGLLVAAAMTAFYMFRLYSLAFWGKARTKEASHAHESSWSMLLPLCVLGLLSIFAGWLETPNILGGIHVVDHWITSSWFGVEPRMFEGHELGTGAEWGLMLFTTLVSLATAWYAFKKYDLKGDKAVEAQGAWADLSRHKVYVDEAYDFAIVRPIRFAGQGLTKILDVFVINGAVHGIRDFVRGSGQGLSLFHTGNVQTYAWYLAFGSAAALVISWMVLR